PTVNESLIHGLRHNFHVPSNIIPFICCRSVSRRTILRVVYITFEFVQVERDCHVRHTHRQFLMRVFKPCGVPGVPFHLDLVVVSHPRNQRGKLPCSWPV